VDGTAADEHPPRVEFRGQVFEVFSYDPELRSEIWSRYRTGQRIRIYGELVNFKGRWEFIVRDRSWLR